MKIRIKSLIGWLGRRLREPSTYVGATLAAGLVGAPPEVIDKIGTAGQLAGIILGTGVAAATTSVHYAPPQD